MKSCIIYYNCLLFSLTKNKTVLSLCSRVTSLLRGQFSWSQPLNTHCLKTIDAFIDIGAGLREVGSTLGARDFSSAASGFCQVFMETRANSFSRGFSLRPKMCWPSANTENSRRTREKPLVPRVRGSTLPNLYWPKTEPHGVDSFPPGKKVSSPDSSY